MSDLDEDLARALREAVPFPPHELDPESMRTAPAQAGRRGVLGPALAAAAMVAVAVTVAALAGGGAPAHRPSADGGLVRPSGGTHQTRPPTGPGESQRQLAAERVARARTAETVERLLASAPTVPGARSVDRSPVKALNTAMSEPASPNLIRRTDWWTARGTMATALRYFRTHPPAGVVVSGGGSASHAGVVTVRGLTFDARGRQWRRPALYTQLELMVAVAPTSAGVAIRVDSEAIWLPQRTPAEHIRDDVTSVQVVVDRRGSARTVRHTFDARHARTLAAVVDGLRVFTPGAYGCAVDRGWTDTLTFRDTSGDVRVSAGVGGCGLVTVGPRSEHNTTLSGGWTVDHAVLRALGLPLTYGQ